MIKILPINVFLFIFFIFFSTTGITSLNEVIKLRIKEINISYEPDKKSHNLNSKKIISFLNDLFIQKGQSEKYYMNIILKRYDVKISKEHDEDFFSLFSSENKKFIHEVNLLVELREIEKNKLIESTNINIQTSKNYDSDVSLSTRRTINNLLFQEVEKKLLKEFKKVFLLKFGDFVVPI